MRDALGLCNGCYAVAAPNLAAGGRLRERRNGREYAADGLWCQDCLDEYEGGHLPPVEVLEARAAQAKKMLAPYISDRFGYDLSIAEVREMDVCGVLKRRAEGWRDMPDDPAEVLSELLTNARALSAAEMEEYNADA